MILSLVILHIVLSVYSTDATEAYAKKGEEGGKGTFAEPVGTISGAYALFDNKESVSGDAIKIIHTADALPADHVEFARDNGIKIVGVTDDGENEAEVELNCDAKIGSDLFVCKKTVTFDHVKFGFPFSLDVNEDPDNPENTEKNQQGESFSLIVEDANTVALTIDKCKFIRPGTIGSEDVAKIHLVRVEAGKFSMNTVECTHDTNKVTFSATPFLID
ncbi:uncharacterized protein MONOS_10592 [Monocercomonoides exilis]|uniref:uncharacterized protein n=1 Tax=Monocercomonoides exilis TaxID=2049356 RepID=UPI00355968E7|nr:hypothetical protein MONOS_10592 [Monocercomonoides exilis]|eukprot:MONOS_10592.1-p1 / transcript=MONOS_10592.1 / gene=MONOS_10592 / organism=Monocercomonoides_exilis_PA203 / gene_product=unspecified product / transcript_product=unspecified product / location=Mono_scaffold00487:28713-29366(-) / protein_length=218 / sequence_SO=supercontig / SO=protein_coding / is_pseudo=false